PAPHDADPHAPGRLRLPPDGAGLRRRLTPLDGRMPRGRRLSVPAALSCAPPACLLCQRRPRSVTETLTPPGRLRLPPGGARRRRPPPKADGTPPAAPRALTSRYIARCSGTSTPARAASRTSEPVMKSTSVRLPERMSSSIDGTWA